MGEDKKNEIAVLMAAGLGSRMRPLTENMPKPLIAVHGVPMIETVIKALKKRGISGIYVVTGYLGEQFAYLEEKYPGLKTVENKYYETVNNISSVYAVCDILAAAEGGCFICEADLYISDPAVLSYEPESSCYFAKYVEGHSDDWVFDLDDEGFITRVGKCGDDAFNMEGISYFTNKDIRLLAELVREAYGKEGYEELFWDEVVDANLDRLRLRVHETGREQIVEIDTPEELAAVAPEWRKRI